jgi:polysaccharide biosynthesis/export protein
MVMRRIFLNLAAVLLFGAAASVAAQDPAADAAREYRLGAGDTIKVQVYQNPDLNLETRVTESGTISYPLIGTVHVGGQTLQEAEKTIAGMLGKGEFVRSAQVTVTLQAARGNQVVMLGRVNKPGRYPLDTNNMRVSDMLAVAGGPSDGAADTAIITGVRDGKPFRREVDITALFTPEGAGDNNPFISGGDSIYVNRAPVYYIWGEVSKPGTYRADRDVTVTKGLIQAGGPTLRASLRSLVIQRIDPQTGVRQEIKPTPNDLILPDDIVFVPESWF